MNRKISVGMAVSIVILAMTVTFSITMLIAMRLFDSTVNSVKEKESMYNKIAEVDRYVRSNDYYTIDEATLYDRLTAGYLLGTGDKYARYYTANAYTELLSRTGSRHRRGRLHYHRRRYRCQEPVRCRCCVQSLAGRGRHYRYRDMAGQHCRQ